MRRVASSRRHLADLLRRRPLLDATVPPTEDPAERRRIDEVRALLDFPEPPRAGGSGGASRPTESTHYPRGSSRI